MTSEIVLNLDRAKALLDLCRAGKLYDVERWIASANSIRAPKECRRTPLDIAVKKSFYSLVELLARNEKSPEIKIALCSAPSRNESSTSSRYSLQTAPM